MKNRQFRFVAIDNNNVRRCTYITDKLKRLEEAVNMTDGISTRCKSISSEYNTNNRILLAAWRRTAEHRTWLDPFSYKNIVGYELWLVNQKVGAGDFYLLQCSFLGEGESKW